VTALDRFQKRLHDVLEAPAADDRAGRAFTVFITGLIVFSVLSVILESEAALQRRYGLYFDISEAAAIVVFSVEYLARLWVCVVDPRYAGPFRGRLRYALSPMALVDLAAVMPFYLESSIDLRFIRALRLVRLARILKIGHYSDSLETVSVVLRKKKADLIVTAAIAFMLLVVVSGLMYFAESGAQPKVFSSIPAAMWWGVTTLTTVGYGDIYPVTPLGKFLAAITAVLGVGFFALPAGILGSAFVVELQRRDGSGAKECPYCGKPVP
jgi:voltage-gated potassium channel